MKMDERNPVGLLSPSLRSKDNSRGGSRTYRSLLTVILLTCNKVFEDLKRGIEVVGGGDIERCRRELMVKLAERMRWIFE